MGESQLHEHHVYSTYPIRDTTIQKAKMMLSKVLNIWKATSMLHADTSCTLHRIQAAFWFVKMLPAMAWGCPRIAETHLTYSLEQGYINFEKQMQLMEALYLAAVIIGLSQHHHPLLSYEVMHWQKQCCWKGSPYKYWVLWEPPLSAASIEVLGGETKESSEGGKEADQEGWERKKNCRCAGRAQLSCSPGMLGFVPPKSVAKIQ